MPWFGQEIFIRAQDKTPTRAAYVKARAACIRLARTEGILLDPVYTAKAMAALIDWIRRGRLTEKDSVLFWHTGGQLALFYAPE